MPRPIVALATLTLGLILLSGQGCPVSGGGNSNGTGREVPPAILIQSPQIFRDLGQGESMTMVYAVSGDVTAIQAFYDLDGVPSSGDEVILSETDQTGVNLTANFDSASVPLGTYQLGVTASGPAGTDVDYAPGAVRVNGLPQPSFASPASELSVPAGTLIEITFNAGDPENDVDWSLFYDMNGVVDGDEADISKGTGNVQSRSWNTDRLPGGVYYIGLKAVDNLGATSTVYNSATIALSALPTPPTITVTAPATPVTITQGGPTQVTVNFLASSSTGGAAVQLFYDQDGVFDGDEQPAGAPVSETAQSSVFDTAGLTPGTYHVGATVDDGLNQIVASYATGSVTVLEAGQALQVTAPTSTVTVSQGNIYNIRWTTTVPLGAGVVNVYRQLNGAGDRVQIGLPNLPPSTGSVAFNTQSVPAGSYAVTVELSNPVSGEIIESIVAPGRVIVSSRPQMVWLGSIGDAESQLDGAIFQGVNFQDLAGTFLTTVSDIDLDGRDDFVIGARYGKPFFQNPSGVGIGEAYLIFGGPRFKNTFNLNAVSLAQLKGVTFTAPRTRSGAEESTEGLSAIRIVPDQDNDLRPEIALGFPFIDSRGHSKTLYIDKAPNLTNTLERPSQFRYGGVVFVSSLNQKLSSPPTNGFSSDPNAPLRDRPVLFLDLVGQNFTLTDTEPTCDSVWNDEINQGDTNDCRETFVSSVTGFSRALAPSIGERCKCFSSPPGDAGSNCAAYFVANHRILLPNDGSLRSCVLSLGITGGPIVTTDLSAPFAIETAADPRLGSGFYPLTGNSQLEPFGARIIGAAAGVPGQEQETGDKYGTSIAVSGNFLLVSAPNHPVSRDEVSGLDPEATLMNNGVIYLFKMARLWPIIGAPPMPFQYQMGLTDPTGQRAPSHCGRDQVVEIFPSPFRVLGENEQKIEITEGIADFNGDSREDFVVGAPNANMGDGAIYIAYRRDDLLESDYILGKIGSDPFSPERLAGSRINGRLGLAEGFGEVVARSLSVPVGAGSNPGALVNVGIDFDGDPLGLYDVVVGNPNADGGGEVVIIFANPSLITPAGGIDIDDLITQGGAARIRGMSESDQFGFNVSIIGDVNGDGINDLLVAAPGASPMFDSNGDGIPDTPGIDQIDANDPSSNTGDGLADDINGDGQITNADLLIDAGLVYLIYGSHDITGDLSIATLGADPLKGRIFVGRTAGDELGGGADELEIHGGPGDPRHKRSYGVGPAGDVDGDGLADFLMGSILADPNGRINAGEAYLIYGSR